jgi:hypothetical protein
VWRKKLLSFNQATSLYGVPFSPLLLISFRKVAAAVVVNQEGRKKSEKENREEIENNRLKQLLYLSSPFNFSLSLFLSHCRYK